MAVMLRTQRDGTPRPKWYAEYKDENGKRKIINTGVKWQGTPPASGSLRERGDAAFELTRENAESVLESYRDEAQRKGNSINLMERLVEAKTGKANEYKKIADLADCWRKIPRESPASPAYLTQCAAVFASFERFMQERNPGALALYQVTPEDAAAWLADSQARYTPKTHRDRYVLLRAAFARFLPVGFNNPFPKIGRQSKAKAGIIHRKPFTPEELQKLIETARADAFLFPLVVCAVCTGLRRGDVCSLRWDAVDLLGNALTVKTSKTGETVSIPIFEQLRAVLESTEKGRSPYVFPEARKMLVENPAGLSWRFKKLIVQALSKQPKTLPTEAAALTPADVQEIRKRIGDADRAGLVLECYRLSLAGDGYKRIAEKMDLPRGTVSHYVRRAVAITGKRGPQTQGKIGRKAITDLTRVQREKGQNAASVRDWHALRTTWVTLALMAGIEMEVVRSVTGHATVDVVVKHYFKPQQKQFHAALIGSMPEAITGTKAKTKALPAAAEMAVILERVQAGTATEKDKKRLRVLAAKL